MSYAHDEFREVAWNGTSFSVPGEWNPAVIEPAYLVLEDAYGPVLELKWHRVQGDRGRTAHLNNLWGQYSRRLGKFVTQIALPETWLSGLKGYVVSGYSGGEQAGGVLGVVMYCPECHRVSLMQFHQRGLEYEEEICQAVLASYRDHRSDGLAAWSVYDIKALLPQVLALTEHQFRPGEFKLSFADKRTRLHLYRWGPASVILRQKSLGEFAAGQAGCPYDRFEIIEEGPETIARMHLSGLARVLSERSVKWPFGGGYRILQYWTVSAKNRVLAVEMTGRSNPDHDLFRLVCESYEVV